MAMVSPGMFFTNICMVSVSGEADRNRGEEETILNLCDEMED